MEIKIYPGGIQTQRPTRTDFSVPEHLIGRSAFNRARKLFRHFTDFYERRRESPTLSRYLPRSLSAPSQQRPGEEDNFGYPHCLSLRPQFRKQDGQELLGSIDDEESQLAFGDNPTFTEPESMLYSGDSLATSSLTERNDIPYSNISGGSLPIPGTDGSYTLRQMHWLEHVLGDADGRGRILSLEGNDAQTFLDFGDWILMGCGQVGIEIYSGDWDHLRPLLRRLVVRLIQTTTMVPKSMFIHDVSIDKNQDGTAARVGSGAYADVYAGRWRSVKTVGVAVKAFRAMEDFHGEIRSEKHLTQVFLREVAIQRYLYHPNLCRPLGVLAEPAPQSSLCIVFPRMLEGNISQYIRSHPAIKQSDKNAMYLGLASALAYIHSENVVHGDIHGGNVLVQHGVAQLADFGVANFADSTPASVSLTRTGASRWMAPEILEAEQEDGPVQHTPASDVFSFGMLMLQIDTGAPPFAALQPGRIKYKIIKGERPPRPAAMDDALWQILQDCWQHKPSDRPTAESLVARLGALSSASDTA